LGDIDLDGYLDLVVGNNYAINRLYLNNGTSDPWNGVSGIDITSDTNGTTAIGLGDVDVDGDLDIIAGNSGGTHEINRLYLTYFDPPTPTPTPTATITTTYTPTPTTTPDIWHYGVPIQIGRSNFGEAIDGDGLIYAIAGWTSAEHTGANSVERFNENTNTWEFIVSFPYKALGVRAASDLDGNVYASGGFSDLDPENHVYYNNLYNYNKAGNSWISLAPMNQARSGHRMVCDTSGNLVVAGGDGISGITLNTVEKYDPDTNTWSSLPSMQEPRSYFALMVDSNNRIFAFGGANNGVHTNTAEMYDPAHPENGWQYVSPLSSDKYIQGSVGPDGKFYLCGGWLPGSTNAVDIYDPETDQYANYSPMNRSTNNMGVVTTESGRIYVIGGDNGDANVEYTDLVNTTPTPTPSPTPTSIHSPTPTPLPSHTPTPTPTPIPPSVPTGLTACGGADSISLSWNPNSQPNVLGYNVYRDTNALGDFSNKITAYPVDGTSYIDNDVISGQEYFYKITAVTTSWDESGKTSAVSATAGSIIVTMPDYRGAPDTDIWLQINCAYATGITGNGMDIKVTYPKTILTPIEIQKTVLTSEFTFMDNISIADGQVNISGVSAVGATITGEGHLLNIKFHVNALAELGTTGIHAFVQVKMYNAALQPLTVDYSDTAIFTVATDYVQGDGTGDGVVDSADALLALQASMGQVTLNDLQFNALDLNGDGLIDSADVTLVLRLAVGLPINPPGFPGGIFTGMSSNVKDKSLYKISLPDIQAFPMNIVDVPIDLSNTEGVASLDLMINYDQTVLNLLEVSKSSLTQGFAFANNSIPGAVKIGLASATPLPTGSGCVATLKFSVIGYGGRETPLYLAYYSLGGQYGEDLSWSASVTKQDGSVKVESEPVLSAHLTWTLYE
jgi:N-acetylneuraminic acid mutarotase